MTAVLSLPVADQDGRAACTEVGFTLFFEEHGASTAEAKSICAGCEIRSACLQGALQRRERYGIWGGTTPTERRRLIRSARRRARYAANKAALVANEAKAVAS